MKGNTEVPMKKINGYENYYITNDGRIWNKNKKRFIKGHYDGKYFVIGLSVNNVRTQYRIHRLVAEYFVKNPNNYLTVKHINENKKDNHYTNLIWADLMFPLDANTQTFIKNECIEFGNFLFNNWVLTQNSGNAGELYSIYSQSKNQK